MSGLSFNADLPIDCITLGRANVDFYPISGTSAGEKLHAARHYDAFVGGSPANIAVGIAKRALRAGIITRVADDDHGRFVVNYLAGYGVDTSQIQYDKEGRKTSLAFAERRKDATTIMYRARCADSALSARELSQKYIQSSKILFISGTALAQEPSRSAVHTAVALALSATTCIAMDIDYRPYGWLCEDERAAVLCAVAKKSHILLGTREEFEVMGLKSSLSDEACADIFLQENAQLVIIKRGKDGSYVFTRDGTKHHTPRVPARLVKPWGAGDAFASALLASLLEDISFEDALVDGAASASLVISGNSCTEALPTRKELDNFLSLWRSNALDESWCD